MNINIKMEDCRFFIDEEKRTVVCAIENTRNKVLDFFNINAINWEESPTQGVKFDPNNALYKKLCLPERFIGKAVCASEDEWNEEVGRILAFDRAKYKLNTSFFKRAQLYIDVINNEFNELIDITNAYGAALEKGAERRKQHIKRLCPTFEEK